MTPIGRSKKVKVSSVKQGKNSYYYTISIGEGKPVRKNFDLALNAMVSHDQILKHYGIGEGNIFPLPCKIPDKYCVLRK
jgi:hypothetical protein